MSDTGWICPRCHAANAPWLPQCTCPRPKTFGERHTCEHGKRLVDGCDQCIPPKGNE